MGAFTQVLVPIDLEETSSGVISVGVAIAQRFDARITLAHAVFFYPLAYTEGFYPPPMEQVIGKANKILEGMALEFQKSYAKIDHVLMRGDPRDEILETARKRNADLIVMGTHGRRGLSRVFLGSVAEWVVRLSPVPVLTVPTRRER